MAVVLIKEVAIVSTGASVSEIMFVLISLADMIRTCPDQFNCKSEDVLIEQIEDKYVNKVLPGSGLGISFYDFVELGDPYVYPAEGGVHQLVKFRMIYFRPFIGEVLEGYICASDEVGIRVSLIFFEDLFIPAHLLQSPSEFDKDKGLWVWKYGEDDDGSFVFSQGCKVRMRVKTIDFINGTVISKGTEISSTADSISSASDAMEPTIARPRSNSIFRDSNVRQIPPMQITAAFNEEGLGLIDWWREDEA